jgi:hypothetical protein
MNFTVFSEDSKANAGYWRKRFDNYPAEQKRCSQLLSHQRPLFTNATSSFFAMPQQSLHLGVIGKK